MNLASISAKISRHRIVAIPIILLTFAAAGYLLAVKPPLYQATSSYILVNPPGPPTPAQIASNPALGHINTNNPYTRYGDLSVIGELISQFMTTDTARAALVNSGAGNYTVAPSLQFGYASPIVEIVGMGSSAAKAVDTAVLVSRTTLKDLNQLQVAKGVAPHYRITTLQVSIPDRAQAVVSGKLRSVVAVIGGGMLLLFVVISLLSGLRERSVLTRPGFVGPEEVDDQPPASWFESSHADRDVTGGEPRFAPHAEHPRELESSLERDLLTAELPRSPSAIDSDQDDKDPRSPWP